MAATPFNNPDYLIVARKAGVVKISTICSGFVDSFGSLDAQEMMLSRHSLIISTRLHKLFVGSFV